MVYLNYLESIGEWGVDRKLKMEQHQEHFSNFNVFFNVFRFFPDYQKQLDSQLGENYSSALQEYLATVLSTLVFALILYFTFSTLLYVYFFKIKKSVYLPNFEGDLKIAFDIKWSVYNILVESWLVSIIRFAWPRYSQAYYSFSEFPLWYIPVSIFFHMIYDETLTYWAHRIMHTSPFMYEKLHKYHHKSLDVTPFSGFAFHPVDAYLQALGTFTSCFWFPIHIDIVLAFSLMTTLWALSIHDNVPLVPCKLFLYSTHHTIHHEIGRGSMSNYGKFTSIWDRMMKSYCDPDRIYYGWKGFEDRSKVFKGFNETYGKIVKDTSSFVPTKNKKKIS